MSEKINNLAVDFQPDAVEIAMRPLPLFARGGVWLGAFLFVTALVASYFAQVDVVVSATGKLDSVEPQMVLKPLDRTVIKAIHVKPGDEVKEGQVLIEFDPEISQMEQQRLETEVRNLQAQYDRLHAEFSGIPFEVKDPLNQSEVSQKVIFDQREKYRQERLRGYDEAIRRYESSIQSTNDSIALQKERLTAMRDIEKMYSEDNAAGTPIGTERNRLELRVSRIQMEAELSKLENGLKEINHQKEGIIADKEAFILGEKKEISSQMIQAQQTLNATRTALDKILKLNEFVNIKAPADAIVHEVAPFPVGSSVREAEPLITLIPINVEIEMEAEISAQDIGRVSVGNQARIKLTAFPFQKYGTLDGVVRNLSENTFTNQMTGNTYYRARITLSGELRNLQRTFRPIPGMEAQAEIKVGTRSVLEYIIHPLIKAFDESIREP